MTGTMKFCAKKGPKPPSLSDPQDIVTITVGKGSNLKTFKTYQDILCYYSPFFDSAFNGPFIEGQSQLMVLEDVNGAAFGLLVAWLYTQNIRDADIEIYCPAEGGPRNTPDIIKDPLRLANLWILAQRFLIPALQNKVIKKPLPVLVESSSSQLKAIVEYAYSGEYTELRMMAAQVLAFTGREDPFLIIVEELCQPALADVTKCLKKYYISKVAFGEPPWSFLNSPEMFYVEDETGAGVTDQTTEWGPTTYLQDD